MKHRKNKITVKKIFCTALAALTLGAYAVTALPQYTGTGITAQAASASVDFEYSNDDYGTIIITGYKGTSSNVVIPSEIDGKSVTEIGEQAFWTCTELTSVTIDNSVEYIGNSAFSGCTGLKSITIGSGVVEIGDSVFSDCSELTDIKVSEGNKNYSSQDGILFNKNKTELINYPAGKSGSYNILDSVTDIGLCAFYGCKGLTSVTIPDGITEINDSTFYGCTELKSITISDNVMHIGNLAFYDCKKLTNIKVTDENENFSVQDGVLFNKDKTELVIYPAGKSGNYKVPDSVVKIGGFSGCTGLKIVTIPDSVTEINGLAFSGCPNVTIHAKSNSYAQQYADNNSINFKSTDSKPTNVNLVQIILIVMGVLVIAGIILAVVILNKRKSTKNKQ